MVFDILFFIFFFAQQVAYCLFFLRPPTGYQDVDVQHRLVEFAKTSAVGKQAGNLRPNVVRAPAAFAEQSRPTTGQDLG